MITHSVKETMEQKERCVVEVLGQNLKKEEGKQYREGVVVK